MKSQFVTSNFKMLQSLAKLNYKIIFLCYLFIESLVMVKKESSLVVPDEVVIVPIAIGKDLRDSQSQSNVG